MLVTDGILFHDELAFLEARVRELWPLVDQFVVVEAPYALSGLEKPYASDTEAFVDRMAPFSEKLRVIRVTNMPSSTDRWAMRARRRMMSEAVMHMAKPDYPILLSEAWKIPRLSIVERVFEMAECPYCLQADEYWWSFWGKSKENPRAGTLLAPYEHAAEYGLSYLWDLQNKAITVERGSWSLRGFRHEEDVVNELNQQDDPTLFNVAWNLVRIAIRKSETGTCKPLKWEYPNKGDVPEWMWSERDAYLAPFFQLPDGANPNPDQVYEEPAQRVCHVRDELKQTLRVKPERG